MPPTLATNFFASSSDAITLEMSPAFATRGGAASSPLPSGLSFLPFGRRKNVADVIRRCDDSFLFEGVGDGRRSGADVGGSVVFDCCCLVDFRRGLGRLFRCCFGRLLGCRFLRHGFLFRHCSSTSCEISKPAILIRELKTVQSRKIEAAEQRPRDWRRRES